MSAAEPHSALQPGPPPDDPGSPRQATVLCVDDEPHILSALRRSLRPAGLEVVCAQSAPEALEMLARTPIDLVISDMRMPGMDGAQLLGQVHGRWPEVVRILLTGHADIASAVAAINQGRIFRYLHKPWSDAELQGAVQEGLAQGAGRREAERLRASSLQETDALRVRNADLERRVEAQTTELHASQRSLKRHYLKAVKAFSNLTGLRSSALAEHSKRVAELARDIARAMALPEDAVLQVFVAGMLHDVGMIGLPDTLMKKPVARHSQEERTAYQSHCVRAEQSLADLDDLQALLPIIRSHHERFDGQGYPDKLAGAAIPLAARIVAVADTFDELQGDHLAGVAVTREEARMLMRKGRGSQFDPEVLDVFLHITEPETPKVAASMVLPTEALDADMVLARDLVSARGVLVLTAGHRLTSSLIARVREFELREGSKLEVHVRSRGTPWQAS
ncbi:MAG: two-component system response regulator [Leptothrix sp. (in: Bacteria)]|nr:two-component system response regulator [Leptothrix sp. (in: b-proteobacteria)]